MWPLIAAVFSNVMEPVFIVRNALDFNNIWQYLSMKVAWMRASRLEISCMLVLVVLNVTILVLCEFPMVLCEVCDRQNAALWLFFFL